jgi:diguanylate cyclase
MTADDDNGTTSTARQSLIARSVDGMVVLEPTNHILYANYAACEFYGLSANDLVGRKFELPIGESCVIERPDGSSAPIRTRLAEGGWGQEQRLIAMRDESEKHLLLADLSRLATQLEASNLELQTANTRLLDANYELADRAEHDPLTSLYNRRGFDALLLKAVATARRQGTAVSAVLLDLDDFKGINTAHGLAGGDLVLGLVADALRYAFRQVDCIARIGGDEFLILLPDTDESGALVAAERIREELLTRSVEIDGQQVGCAGSFGVAQLTQEQTTLDDILLATQRALSQAKASGKNVVQSASALPRRMDNPVARLERGDGFEVVQLPLIRLADGARVGTELLTRGPLGPFQLPVDLFRLAHDQAALARIDKNCFRHAAELASRHLPSGRIHINLSPTTLLRYGAQELLDAAGAIADRLCVEFSERTYQGPLAPTLDHVASLRRAGVSIAVEDVGAGASSVEALLTLRPDVIKLDRRLLRRLVEDVARQDAVQGLLAVGAAIDALVVVVGVEDDEERKKLMSLGVVVGQGFLWGEPKPLGP